MNYLFISIFMQFGGKFGNRISLKYLLIYQFINRTGLSVLFSFSNSIIEMRLGRMEVK